MTGGPNEPGHDQAPRCGAKKRGALGSTCALPAGWGTDHVGFGACKLHGGKTPNHRAAARMEMARQAVVTYGLPREVAPDVALLEEVHRTAGHVAWLGQKVAALDPEEITWGVAEEVDRGSGEFTGVDRTEKAAVNVWVQLYQQERKHLTDVCKAALAAGIAERQVRLAEQQGALLAGVIGRVLDALGLTPAQRELVAVVVPRELRAVAGGDAA
jgi:hypothetical protein